MKLLREVVGDISHCTPTFTVDFVSCIAKSDSQGRLGELLRELEVVGIISHILASLL